MSITPNLNRHVSCPPREVSAATVRVALETVFALNPALRGYVLDDQGLPAPPAFDLVYRHGLDVAPDAEWLAMGSTTGSLWVSADQGESWQCLSTHLPPIYAVRFA